MVDSTGSISGDRHEAMKERRLEAERVTLLARIQKEQDRLVDIQRQKDERRDQIMHRRTMRMQVESAAAGPIGGAEADDDDPPGTADPHAAQAGKKGAAAAATSRRMQSPRRMAKKAPKFEEFTKKEKERLGIIKKQRCAVCRRVYELDNLPGVVSYRVVEKLREKWGKEFGSEQTKDPRYAAPTKLCDQVRVCVFHVVFCFQFFDPDEDEHPRHG